jgi:phage-related protein
MDRDELHDLVISLKEKLAAGRLVLRDPGVLRELSEVRFADDGKVDPATVGSRVRATAYASAAADASRAIERIPLQEVQSRYFEILENNFGSAYSQMKRRGLNPQQAAGELVQLEQVVNAFTADLPEFASGLADFWDFHGPVVEHHLRKRQTLKSVFGGDVFPSYTENIACSVGLYADTIVLPDPLHRLTTYASVMAPQALFRLAVKHALNVLSYRDLALAELDVPIVVIAPDYIADTDYRRVIQSATDADLLEHFSALFGTHFSAQSELNEFLKPLSDFQSLLKRAVEPDRILFDAESNAPLPEQFRGYEDEFLKDDPAASRPGYVLKHMVMGRLLVANDVALRGIRLSGNPLIDAPTSWRYFQWKNEYQQKSVSDESASRRDTLISKALSLDGREQRMLNGIPPEALIELRKNGALSELRETIRRGIDDVDSATEADLVSVANHVIENIDNALSEHARQLETLKDSRLKFYGLDVSRSIAVGGFSIAAVLSDHKWLDVLGAVGAVLGTSKIEELLTKHREFNAESGRLKRSPTGIMFRHIRKNFCL